MHTGREEDRSSGHFKSLLSQTSAYSVSSPIKGFYKKYAELVYH
jgi:hypothetical protein